MPISRTSARFRPGIENLEARWCPSTTITTINNGHTVVIRGDNNANVVSVVQNDNRNKLTVEADGQTQQFNSSDITAVTAQLLSGNDRFSYTLGGGSNFKKTKSIRVDTGLGNDAVTTDFSAGGAKVKADLSVAVFSEGASGFVPAGNLLHTDKDAFTLKLGDIDNAHVTAVANLGIDNDTITATVDGDLEDAAKVTLNFQENELTAVRFAPTRITNMKVSGNDTFTVNVAGDATEDDLPHLDVSLGGGSGRDAITFNYQGEMDGLLKLNVDGGSGLDTVFAQIDLDGGSNGRVEAQVKGGQDADVLTLRIIGDLDDVTVAQAVLVGGGGIDTLTATANVTVVQ